MYTPAYVIGRQPAHDLICTVRNKQGDVVLREKIAKKVGILCAPTFAGRDPHHYDKPDEFNPHRFENQPKTLSWLPFGDGKHVCPGQWLAKAEVVVLIALLIQKYEIKSFPEKKFQQRGYITLKPSEEIWMTLTERYRSELSE